MEGKHPLLSKTLWFNVLALVLVVARHYGYAEFVPSSLVGPLGVVAVAAVDIVLRLDHPAAHLPAPPGKPTGGASDRLMPPLRRLLQGPECPHTLVLGLPRRRACGQVRVVWVEILMAAYRESHLSIDG